MLTNPEKPNISCVPEGGFTLRFFFFFPGMRVTTSPYEISLQERSFQRFPGREYFFEFSGGFREELFLGIFWRFELDRPIPRGARAGKGVPGSPGLAYSGGLLCLEKISTRSDMRTVGIAMCALHAVIDGKRTFTPDFQKPPMRPEGPFGGMEGFEEWIRSPPDMGRFPVPQKIERIPCTGGWLHPPVFFFFFPGMRVTTSPYEISLQGLSFSAFSGPGIFF